MTRPTHRALTQAQHIRLMQHFSNALDDLQVVRALLDGHALDALAPAEQRGFLNTVDGLKMTANFLRAALTPQPKEDTAD